MSEPADSPMDTPDPRALLLEQARVQLALVRRGLDEAIPPLQQGLETLAERLGGTAPLTETDRGEVLALLLAALERLQFHDREQQRLEHLELALALAGEGPGADPLGRLQAAFTLPEERDAFARLAQGESRESVLAHPWRDEGPPSELF